MPHIELLDQITIDKIAAGEVIERPASVIKELVENAIDAGATAVVVEIEDGGITFMRITDNGCGIDRDDVRKAFLRHSTSKIRSADDLVHISSLGFRGEALSSIAAVAQVELVTKTADAIFGTRYVIEGGQEKVLEETGAPDGTTFLVRQLFYNTPARRKFLKTPMTEASHISDLLTRLALSHPEVSFQFINNHQPKIHTSGNGRLKDVIYHIYGREIANNLLPMDFEWEGMQVNGFLGKPLISRGNRNFENYFVNGRYIRSNILSKGIEDAYKDFTMQHKYPFVAFHIQVDPEKIDVNVHPTKMELRFSNQQEIYNRIYQAVSDGLHEKNLIPEVEVPEPRSFENMKNDRRAEEVKNAVSVHDAPNRPYGKSEPAPIRKEENNEEKNLDYFMKKMKERVQAYHNQVSHAEVESKEDISKKAKEADRVKEAVKRRIDAEKTEYTLENNGTKVERTLEYNKHKTECAPIKTDRTLQNEDKIVAKTERDPQNNPQFPHNNPQIAEENKQLDLFEENLLKKETKQEYKIIGQVFDTYWLVQFQDSLYIIDQHAAHERVLYERTLAGMKNREYTSQYLSPPIILSLSMQEIDVLETHKDRFTSIGFEIEPFGGDEYAVRAVPDNLFGIAKKELLLEMLDGLSDGLASNLEPSLIDEKIASMSCKAAVKGNSRLSAAEVDALIGELLTLENPYHCPHGRPTIIAMTKRELEKKFKRII
ncbi:MAG: DNA mismatch repair endonuclease MutL [Bariatricus sp.]